MTYRALKEVVGTEAHLLSRQRISYSSLNFVRNICGFYSIIS